MSTFNTEDRGLLFGLDDFRALLWAGVMNLGQFFRSGRVGGDRFSSFGRFRLSRVLKKYSFRLRRLFCIPIFLKLSYRN
jgi:hypothetical protein